MLFEEIPHKAHSQEIDLRVIGQALETLGIDSFELVLEGDSFVVHGPSRRRSAKNERIRAFHCSG
jgi:hypothetical protein